MEITKGDLEMKKDDRWLYILAILPILYLIINGIVTYFTICVE